MVQAGRVCLGAVSPLPKREARSPRPVACMVVPRDLVPAPDLWARQSTFLGAEQVREDVARTGLLLSHVGECGVSALCHRCFVDLQAGLRHQLAQTSEIRLLRCRPALIEWDQFTEGLVTPAPELRRLAQGCSSWLGQLRDFPTARVWVPAVVLGLPLFLLPEGLPLLF